MGHPAGCTFPGPRIRILRQAQDGLRGTRRLWRPTLATKTNASRGWGTQSCGLCFGGFEGCWVDLLGYLAELAVGGLFFGEGFVEELGDLLLPEQRGVLAHAAVSGHLIVLHALGGGDEGCVTYR